MSFNAPNAMISKACFCFDFLLMTVRVSVAE